MDAKEKTRKHFDDTAAGYNDSSDGKFVEPMYQALIEEIQKNCKLQHLRFGDHHTYSRRDISRIREAFDAIKGSRKIIITTEKDAIRLRGMTQELPVYVQPIKVAFHQDGDMVFDQVIESSVRENISFLSKLSIWN